MRVSQCMIVKNEEANIERALSWGKGFVWEQIVVDTGSTDQTVDIAKSMGACVYDLEWADDFAAARNFAMSLAKGDWIALLDADEYFAPQDVKTLETLLTQLHGTETEAIAAACINLNEKGKPGSIATQIRVFRNKPELRYRRRIHEQLLAEEGRRPMRVLDATKELSVFHTGYCGEAYQKKNVSKRNLRLLQKELEDHPGDSEILGYLGDEYHSAGQSERAAWYYRQAIEAMPSVLDELDARSAATFTYLLQILGDRQAPDEEIDRIYSKGERLLPGEADFDYIMGRSFASRGEYEKGAAHLELALAKLERFGTNNRSMRLQAGIQDAYEVLALCYLNQGELQKGIHCSIAVLKYAPHSTTSLVVLLKCLKGDREEPATPADQTTAFLSKLYDMKSSADRQILATAAKTLGWPALERALEASFSGSL